MAMTATLTEMAVLLPPEILRKLKPLFPEVTTDAEAVAAAAHAFLASQGRVTISPKALQELAARAGTRKPIRSEDDLVKAFECITKLDANSCVVHLEPAEIPQIAASAQGQKIPIGEAIVQYLTHAICSGWFSERVEVKHLMFQPAEWATLAGLLGVPSVRTSDHLIKLLVNLKKNLRDAQEEARALRDAAEAALPEEVETAPELPAVDSGDGDLEGMTI